MKKIVISTTLVIVLLFSTIIGVSASGATSGSIRDSIPIADKTASAFEMSITFDNFSAPTIYPNVVSGYYSDIPDSNTYRILYEESFYSVNDSTGQGINIAHSAHQPILDNGYSYLENRWVFTPQIYNNLNGSYNITLSTPYMIIDVRNDDILNGYKFIGQLIGGYITTGNSIDYSATYKVAYPITYSNSNDTISQIDTAFGYEEFSVSVEDIPIDENGGVLFDAVSLSVIQDRFGEDYGKNALIDFTYLIITDFTLNIQFDMYDYYQIFALKTYQPTNIGLQEVFLSIYERVQVPSRRISFNDVNPIKWVSNFVGDFLETDLFNGVTFASIVFVCVALGVIFAVLKIFAGG